MTYHLNFFNFVFTQRNREYLVLVLYSDIYKAFDMFNHQLLIGKVASYGVQNPLFAWFSSVLSHWHQTVQTKSSLSDSVPVRSRVIQVMILDTLLFPIYTNDIWGCFCMGKPLLYRDDLKVAYSFLLMSWTICKIASIWSSTR